MNSTTTPEPRLRHVQCLAPEGLHRMAYWEWGDATNPSKGYAAWQGWGGDAGKKWVDGIVEKLDG